MKVLKPGIKITEIKCPVCEALLAYDDSDIMTEVAEQTGTNWESKYIICPECNHKIVISSER